MSESAFGPDDRVFLSRDALVGALAIDIAAKLNAAVEARGGATFAASGGSTPRPLYERLARTPLDWTRITVVLVDERWVDPGAPGSNEALVRETLLQGRASAARFRGLKTPAPTPQAGAAEANARLSDVAWPIDAALLGMGGDGHTASWFPHADGLAAALDPAGALPCAPVRASKSDVTGDHLDRMTLTFPILAASGFAALMITGEDKRDTLAVAQSPGPVEDMPIRALLRNEATALRVYWAP